MDNWPHRLNNNNKIVTQNLDQKVNAYVVHELPRFRLPLLRYRRPAVNRQPGSRRGAVGQTMSRHTSITIQLCERLNWRIKFTRNDLPINIIDLQTSRDQLETFFEEKMRNTTKTCKSHCFLLSKFVLHFVIIFERSYAFRELQSTLEIQGSLLDYLFMTHLALKLNLGKGKPQIFKGTAR